MLNSARRARRVDVDKNGVVIDHHFVHEIAIFTNQMTRADVPREVLKVVKKFAAK